MPSKLSELNSELRQVLSGRGGVLDLALPPLVFLILARWLGFPAAIGGALLLGCAALLWRLFRRQPWLPALGGVMGTLLAGGLVFILGGAENFFLPGILTGLGTAILAAASALVRRPLVAWTSYITRRWPLDWYWRPDVRPAYSETTWLWAVFFALRAGLQLILYRRSAPELLAALNLIGGWPGILVLLVITYLYGTWRLRRLGGPSVEEFQSEASPPYTSQQRGF